MRFAFQPRASLTRPQPQTLNNGSALVQNHLYMMTIEGRGVRATAATTKLLVRGSYTVA